MRKLMLSLVFVLGAMTMVNANNEVEKVNIITPIAVTVEDDGCAGDCVSDAKAGALAFAENQTDRGQGSELMGYYKRFYKACFDANNCGGIE